MVMVQTVVRIAHDKNETSITFLRPTVIRVDNEARLLYFLNAYQQQMAIPIDPNFTISDTGKKKTFRIPDAERPSYFHYIRFSSLEESLPFLVTLLATMLISKGGNGTHETIGLQRGVLENGILSCRRVELTGGVACNDIQNAPEETHPYDRSATYNHTHVQHFLKKNAILQLVVCRTNTGVSAMLVQWKPNQNEQTGPSLSGTPFASSPSSNALRRSTPVLSPNPIVIDDQRSQSICLDLDDPPVFPPNLQQEADLYAALGQIQRLQKEVDELQQINAAVLESNSPQELPSLENQLQMKIRQAESVSDIRTVITLLRVSMDNAYNRERELVEQEDEARRCVVCLDAYRTIFFRPCSHYCTCEECGSSLDQCPICREGIAETFRIYQ